MTANESPEPAASDPLGVVAVLSAAGWYPGRHVDIRGWVAALREDGYPVFPAAERVLAEYGGLAFTPPYRAGAKSGPGRVSFVPLAESAGERERIRDREAQLGQPLCAVGEWWDGEFMLLVGGDGRVYAETSGAVLDLGPTIEVALDQMIVRSRPVRDIRGELPGEMPEPAQ